MKSETYYIIRTAVRGIFWSLTILVATLGVSALQDIVAALEDDREQCDIVLNRDFTWDSSTGLFLDVNTCAAPTNVTLLQGGTWEWTE